VIRVWLPLWVFEGSLMMIINGKDQGDDDHQRKRPHQLPHRFKWSIEDTRAMQNRYSNLR
jgi:hypothetical protein